MATQVDPNSFTNAFNAERDRGTRNQLINDQREQQRFQNARVTAADAQQNTLFEQQQGDRAQEQKRVSLSRVGAIAKQALTMTGPQRKGFLQQTIPAYGQDFAAIGSDTTKLDAMLALPDDQLTKMLTQVSAFAPTGEAYTLGKGEKRMLGTTELANNPDPSDGPPGFTLTPGDVRFDATGKRIAAVDPKAPTKPELFDVAAKLRGEYNKLAQEFTGVADSFQRIKDSASNPSAAGDLALIFNYMKVLDPGSTVREGEFATAANAGSVEARVYGLYNRVMKGERLAAEQRADFVNRAGTLYKGQEDRFNTRVKARYEGLAKRYGLDPAEVLSDPTTAPAAAPELTASGPDGPLVLRGGQWVKP